MNQRWILALLLALPGLGLAADSGQTTIATDLKREPYIDAQNSGNLPANTPVEIVKRQGGWLQVKSASGEGWVKLLAVKLSGSTPAASGNAGVKELLNVAQTGRSGNSGTTVATGVRGLTPEDLKNPTPNPEAVKKLDSFVVSKAEAESFARRENLASHPVDYLQPGKAATSSTESSAGGLFGGIGK